jgi:hypothetical protein
MRIVVVSDSHGRNDNVKQAVAQTKKKYGTVDALLHMGDVEDDVDEIKSMIKGPVYIVAGNNDGGLGLPQQLNINLGGKEIMMTHGHRFGVDYDLHRLELLGAANGADIVMYGHTHYPSLDRNGEPVMLNPGSLTYPRQEGRVPTFMVMEIDEEGNVEYYWQELEDDSEKKGFFQKIFGV